MPPFLGSFLCYLNFSIHISYTSTSSLLKSHVKYFNPQVHFAVNIPGRINAFLTYSPFFLPTKGLLVMLPDFPSENIIFVWFLRECWNILFESYRNKTVLFVRFHWVSQPAENLLHERGKYRDVWKRGPGERQETMQTFPGSSRWKGTGLATKPTLFSSQNWFENFQRCFSWQKVRLIGTSRPAVYFTADKIPSELKETCRGLET